MLSEILEALAPHLIEAFAALLTFAITWAAWRFRKWTGIQIEEKHQRALHSAIMSGIRAAIDAEPGHRVTDAKEVLIAKAVAHARESVPDALMALKPGGFVLERLAERYLNEALAGR